MQLISTSYHTNTELVIGNSAIDVSGNRATGKSDTCNTRTKSPQVPDTIQAATILQPAASWQVQIDNARDSRGPPQWTTELMMMNSATDVPGNRVTGESDSCNTRTKSPQVRDTIQAATRL
ncbi:hypothetical protein AVEN_86316-1 [Araneus ventricosus]|uniref:Uncharacterized protein n=1 Tax=Araneus ventricosus TaxID=182803 RepID=A0A4Y2IGE0_ARAVE|nr:hypothetical protein AVEN_86316-1 [Araneus ventricosus]